MHKPEDGEKGFAGLESMVSNIESDVADTRKSPSPPPAHTAAAEMPVAGPVVAPPSESTASRQPRTTYSQPQKASGGSGTRTWGWIIAIVVLLAIFNTYNKSPPSTTTQAPPSASYTPAAPRSSNGSYVAPTAVFEQMPPVGSGRTFSDNEIRYCLSQDVRIDSMRSTVNSYSSYEIDQFNAVVSDYNSRCSNFRYRRGALEAVRSEVEVNRSLLSAEGSNKVLAWRQQDSQRQAPNYARTPSPTPMYVPPASAIPAYTPTTPRFPDLNIDQAEINRLQEEGRQYMRGFEAAQRVCGQVPTNMELMDTWMACMSRQGY